MGRRKIISRLNDDLNRRISREHLALFPSPSRSRDRSMHEAPRTLDPTVVTRLSQLADHDPVT